MFLGLDDLLDLEPTGTISLGLSESLSWGNTLFYYVFGGEQDLNVSINEVYPQQGLNFGGRNEIGYDTNGPAGQITFQQLENGNIIARPDTFDFDPQPGE